MKEELCFLVLQKAGKRDHYSVAFNLKDFDNDFPKAVKRLIENFKDDQKNKRNWFQEKEL